jgi:hypothetical protein
VLYCLAVSVVDMSTTACGASSEPRSDSLFGGADLFVLALLGPLLGMDPGRSVATGSKRGGLGSGVVRGGTAVRWGSGSGCWAC